MKLYTWMVVKVIYVGSDDGGGDGGDGGGGGGGGSDCSYIV